MKSILDKHQKWLSGEKGGERANLERASLIEANLKWANLERANLKEANLERAYLERAYLERANLKGAYLKWANLDNAKLPTFQLCLQEGSFIGYKKTTKGVIKILIPEDAQRTSSLVGRKCRASKVIVLEGEGIGGKSPTHGDLVYDLGSTVVADKYDPDIRVECTNGIHFFMTEEEARNW